MSGPVSEEVPDAGPDAADASDPPYRIFDCTGDDPAELAEATDAARDAVERGECVVLPTDTVYGIGADAFSPEAVQRLLDAKRRGRDMPSAVLIADASLIRALATDVPPAAHTLVEAFWPGSLTVILQRQPSLRMDLGETEGTIALRVPDHELAREVLRRTGPMAVSSANLNGRPAALTAGEALEQLGDSVSVYLDGGQVGGGSGAASTIVDFTKSDDGQVLRRGALTLAALREVCPDVEDLYPAETAEPTEPTESEESEEPEQPEQPEQPEEREEPGEPKEAAPVLDPVLDPVDSDPVPESQPHPDTDELRITHRDGSADQPDLFSDPSADAAER